MIQLALIILVGAITSWEDIKFGKIRNKWVISATLIGLMYYYFIFATQFFNESFVLSDTYPLLINTVLALFVGYWLWHFKLWSAGDAKLFTAYAFLVPLSTYTFGFVAYFPSYTILVNTMFVLCSYLVFKSLGKKRTKSYLKEEFKPAHTIETFVHILGVGWLARVFCMVLPQNQF